MDILTVWNVEQGQGDWRFDDYVAALLAADDGTPIVDDLGNPIVVDRLVNPDGRPPGSDLATAILISLFTDATASSDDGPLPDGDPRGWWGAADIGSKLWLRGREKQQPALLLTVRDDIRRALAWLIDDGVAADVAVETEFTRPGMLGARVTITRATGGVETLAVAWAWRGL